MTSAAFRLELERRLLQNADQILLRVGLAPDPMSPLEFTGPALVERARNLARHYSSSAEAGHVVLLLLPHSAELFLLHFGLILEGRVPAILPWPTSRMDPEKYQRNLLHQLRSLPARHLITLPKLAANLASLPYGVSECHPAGFADLEKAFVELSGTALEASAPWSPSVLDDAVFLQFSGGTTGAQKAVVVTPGMMTAQMDRLREALHFGAEDGVASWLPMYHDMGLIACLWFPIWHQRPSIQIGAGDWLLQPDLLFACLDRYRATFCWMPNFAFAYLAGQRERMTNQYSLGHVRGFINCSEPVRKKSVQMFCDTFADFGVSPTSVQASYAMAENVFAVTQTALDREPATAPRLTAASTSDEVSFRVMDDRYVSSGAPLSGMSVRIVHPDGALCADGEPGEIRIHSESLFAGYWGTGAYQSASIQDGWYATGDYGFLKDGELYVVGRLKDIVIVGGQNVFPEDVETIVNGLSWVYPGRVVAFGLTDDENGTEALAVVAELRGDFDPARSRTLQREVQNAVLAAIGIAPRFVAVVPERWIVKSTAGKISRRDTKTRYVEEFKR